MESLSVSWEEYQRNICNGLGALQQRGEFVDMTLAADGHHVKVHQMVLSLVSPFIKDLITSANCPHPIIFLNKVSHQTMLSILEYAYTGEVVVRKENMGEFLEACTNLHIKGLEAMLRNAQSTVSTMFDSHGPERDSLELEGEHSSIPSRRKTQHCEENMEVNQFSEDDFLPCNANDDFQTDINNEVTVETTEIKGKMEKHSSKDPLQSATHNTTDSTLTKPPLLQYSVSCHGNLQAVLNRFVYGLRHVRKDGRKFWRCINQQGTGCLASLITEGDHIGERSTPHNHAFHDRQILKRVRSGNMFSSVRAVEHAAGAKKRQRTDLPLADSDTPPPAIT